jgi:site-specific recombinase XerC
MMAPTVALLRRYLDAQHHHEPRTPLFPGRRGPLGKRQIEVLFCRYRDRAGLPRRYTTHSLRHSIATHLIDANMTLQWVQQHLGHVSIRTTLIYAKLSDRHRAEVFRQLEHSPWIVQPQISSSSEHSAAEAA